MGYRNYFYLVDKNTAEGLSQIKNDEELKTWLAVNNPDFLDYFKNEDYVSFLDISPDLEEAFEFGKLYFDEDGIENAVKKKSKPLWTKEEAPELYERFNDYGVRVCNSSVLPDIVKIYKNKILGNYNEIWETANSFLPVDDKLSFLTSGIERRVSEWSNFSIPPKGGPAKYDIVGSWLYEYEIFNLTALYKYIDWNKKSLLYLGY